MAPITVTKSRLALPWFGAIVLIVEIGTYSNLDTLVLSSVDGGQGISFVYGVLGFKNTGATIVTNPPTVSSNGTTVTLGSDTTLTTLIVFGR